MDYTKFPAGENIEQISEEFNVEETITYLVTIVALKIKRKLNDILKNEKFDISPEQFFVLGTLHWHGSMSLSDLAKKTHKDNANITRMVDVMEKKGLVLRMRDEEDKRAVKLVLTNEGSELYMSALKKIIEYRTLILPGLGNAELEKFKKIALRLIENLDESDI